MQQNPVDLHNIINQIIDNDNNTHVINNNIQNPNYYWR